MTEEVIIDLKLDQDEGDFAKLAQLKTSILNIKQEQAQLSRAYKEGSITIKEFASESVRLEANQKKLSAAYSETQRKVTGLKSPFEKLSGQISEQTKQVNIAGLSLASFANPVTATVAVLGGLFSAYKNSTIGAKDFEFAQNQLSAATGLLTNQLASLVSSAEDGEGALTTIGNRLADLFTSKFNIGTLIPRLGLKALGVDLEKIKEESKEIALIQEKQQDLQRGETKIRADNADRLEQNQEKLSAISRVQTTYNEKMILHNEIIQNLKDNQAAITGNLEKQFQLAKDILAKDPENEDKQEAVNQAEKNLNRERGRAERLIQAAIRAQDDLTDAVNKTAKAEREKNDKILDAQEKKRQDIDKKIRREFGKKTDEDTQRIAGTLSEDWLGHNKTIREADDKNAKKSYDDRVKASEDAANKQIKDQEKLADRTTTLFANQVNVYKSLLEQGNSIGVALYKGFLINILRMLKSQLQAEIIGKSLATPDSIATFGATGAFRAAIIVALLEAAFGAAEAAVMGFSKGGKVEGRIGAKIRRSNGDDRIITAKTGEVVLTERQQAALGGPATFAKIGVPGFSRANTGQTGFAIGGRIPMPDDSNRMLRRAFDRMKVAVVIEDIERLDQVRARVVERATI